MLETPNGLANPTNHLESCRKVPVERAHDLTPEIFYRRYLTGLGKPVIITDEMNTWNARSKWTFDFFKSRYGSENVLPTIWPGTKHTRLMKLADYISYIQSPNEKSPGIWIDPNTKIPLPGPPKNMSEPLYLYGWRAFYLHPELFDDISQNLKSVDDWLPLFPTGLRKVINETTRYYSHAVLVGPANSKSHLHQDFLNLHATLAQIVGRKKCTLFSPEDSAALYNGDVDPDQPALDQFPLFRNATAFECVLEPGELLFMPSLCWHHVIALENSITVNYNFFNRVNFAAYFTDLLQRLPTLVAGIEKLPDAKKILGIDWASKGFDFPDCTKTG